MLAVELLTRVGLATLLGVIIGLERQWRSRMAGLQTMALVCMGSALFVILSAYSFGQDGDRLRVAAQIVSGVGFLGAGVIMKQGHSVTGLNTAATLWATAAVGALVGAWMWREAVAAAAMVVIANWLLQPLANRMDRMHHTAGRDIMPADYILDVVCSRDAEDDVKAAITTAMPAPQFRLRAVRALTARAPGQIELRAEYSSAVRDDQFAEDAVRALSLRPGTASARWIIDNERTAR